MKNGTGGGDTALEPHRVGQLDYQVSDYIGEHVELVMVEDAGRKRHVVRKDFPDIR